MLNFCFKLPTLFALFSSYPQVFFRSNIMEAQKFREKNAPSESEVQIWPNDLLRQMLYQWCKGQSLGVSNQTPYFYCCQVTCALALTLTMPRKTVAKIPIPPSGLCHSLQEAAQQHNGLHLQVHVEKDNGAKMALMILKVTNLLCTYTAG